MSHPAWEIAQLFHDEGSWPEGDYLALDTKRLVEFVDGTVEVLPSPSPLHQLVVRRIFEWYAEGMSPRAMRLSKTTGA